MTEWNEIFSNLKKADDAKEEERKIAARQSLEREEADIDRAEAHIKNIVKPVFDDVVTAAKNNGFYAEADNIVEQYISGPKTGVVTTGAELKLSKTPPTDSRQASASIRIERQSEDTFDVTINTPSSTETRHFSIDVLDQSCLENLLRQVLDRSFN